MRSTDERRPRAAWSRPFLLALCCLALTGCGDTESAAVPADSAGPVSGDAAPAEVSTSSDAAAGCAAPQCPCLTAATCDSAVCLEHRDGQRRCASPCSDSAPCPAGERCAQVGAKQVCVDPGLTLCDPCVAASDCKAPGVAGAQCIQGSDGAGRCGMACQTSAQCPEGYVCDDGVATGGAPLHQCLPKVGECPCSPRAVQLGLAVPCAVPGSCAGQRTCTDQGLSACQGKPAAAEECNGLDDDCDGATDEGASCDDGNPCSRDACNGTQGCSHSDALIGCDDDNPCTSDPCDAKLGCLHFDKPGCVIPVPYAQGFSCQTLPPWTLSPGVAGQPRWGVDAFPGLGVGAPGYRSADCSLNFNLGQGLACEPTGTTAEGTATSPRLSALTASAEAALRLRFYLAGSWRPTDTLRAEVSEDGAVWTEAANFDPPAGGSWHQVEADLSPWIGKTFKLRLRFEAISCDEAGAMPGPFVDDLVVADVSCAAAKDCDDADPCTDDLCIGVTHLCKHKPSSGAPCSDNNPCTLSDQCFYGSCEGKNALNGLCDDGDPCTFKDKCSSGECDGVSIDGPCDDANPCTQQDHCDLSVGCVGQVTGCDDGNPCTFDVCDVGTGACASAAASETLACDDGDPCTDVGFCHAGVCLSRFGCDDANPCTQDYCVLATGGCAHTLAMAGLACSDGDACSAGDSCTQGGLCKGAQAPCSAVSVQSPPCAGDPAWQRSTPSVPDGASWRFVQLPPELGPGCALAYTRGEDATCTGSQTHTAGTATRVLDLQSLPRPVLRLRSHVEVGSQVGVNLRWVDVRPVGSLPWVSRWLPNDTESGAPWRDLRVDLSPWEGQAVEVRLSFDSATCPAPLGRGWFIGEIALEAGVATPCAGVAECEDGNACTLDNCLNAVCVRQYAGGPCDDGNACSAGDGCAPLGECTGPKVANCDDEDPCTIDSCVASSGCQYAPRPDGAPCYDGDPCTVGEACLGGSCLVRPKCEDGNPCTTDVCQSDGSCTHEHLPGGTPCDDANPCTGKDFCTQGQCQGPAVPCKAAWIEPVACGPGGWTFGAGSWPSAPAWAADASPAPPAAHTGTCSLNVNNGVNLSCSPNGEAAEAAATSQPVDLNGLTSPALWLWSLHDVGTAANANLRRIEVSTDDFATLAVQAWLPNSEPALVWVPQRLDLSAVAGQVVRIRLHWIGLNCLQFPGKGWFVDDLTVMSQQPQPCTSASSCEDGNPCTVDGCAAGACVFVAQPGPCDDGNACTVADHCAYGKCLAVQGNCEDGNTCTLDSCTATEGCVHAAKGDGALCDDGNNCTTAKKCASGLCAGTAASEGTSCIDGDVCLMGQTCKAGACQGGTPIPDGTACSDDSGCTGADVCAKGQCVGSTEACDDHEACTLDSCWALQGSEVACAYKALGDGSACADGDPCTEQTTCQAGLCEGPQKPGCIELLATSFADPALPPTWTADPPKNQVGWAVDATPALPPAHSPPWSLNLNNGKDFDSGVAINAAVELPPVQVPLQGAAQLAMWSWHDGEAGWDRDQRVVEVLLGPGKQLAASFQLPNHVRRGLWSKILVPLDKFAGQQLRVRLRFDSVDSLDNEAPGWFVDDLRIQVAQPTACKLQAECVQGGEPCQPTLCQAGLCKGTVLQGDCDDGDDCTESTSCIAGVCLGSAVDCDDGYACTADSCAFVGGCSHKELFGCGVFTPPYSQTFTCGDVANTYWKADPPVAPGGPQWGIDATPSTPGAWSPDCSLNFNDGKATQCPTGIKGLQAHVTSPLFDLSGFKPDSPVAARLQLAGSWQTAAGEALGIDVQPLGASEWTQVAAPLPQAGWRSVVLDLSGWAGLQLRLRLRFGSACQGGAGTGPFVDAFEVFDAACKTAAACNDGDPCTADLCDLQVGVCGHQPLSSGLCDDGNPCTVSDACAQGQCLGSPKACDDGQPCTLDLCDPASGACSAMPSGLGSPCSDGNPCTINDICGPAGCQGQAKADASPCSDGNGCTTGDQCQAGQCTSAGVQPDGTFCTDANPCTTGDHCASGACLGDALSCDDGNPCTADLCVPVGALSSKCAHQWTCP